MILCDEFVLLLRDANETDAARPLRRLQETSETAWCFGVTEVQADDDLDRALARADKRLYEAKTSRPRIPRQRSSTVPSQAR